MDSVSAPILSKTGFCYRIPAFRPKSSFAIRCRKYQLKSNQSVSTLFLKTQISSPPSFSNGVKSRIWSQFGRTTRRRNYLRKKLIEEQQQVRDIRDFPTLQTTNDVSTETNLNFSDSKSNNFGVVEGDVVEYGSLTKPELISDSALWNKLGNWVDQYTKDPEFWGVGSGPIFTIFEDSDENVERVVVDEDEILRRSRIETRSSAKPGLKDHTAEVDLKISGAKRLAREIEAGNYKIPKSSSIAKFVVSGKQYGLVGKLFSGALQPNLSRRISRLGFTMLCGSLMVWVIRRLLMPDNDVVELTREEKEMLRRKMKSRMEKEKMMAGTVEVLPNVSEPVMESIERPQLDKQELVNTISKAKESKDKLASVDIASTLTSKADNFDDKIQEIRAMARHARQLEQHQSSSFSSDGEENEAVNGKMHHGMSEGKSQKEVGSFPNSLLDGDSENPGCINGTMSSLSVNDSKEEDTGFLGELSFKDTSKESGTSARSLSTEASEDERSSKWVPEEKECTSHVLEVKEAMQLNMDFKHSEGDLWNPDGTSRPTSVDEKKTEGSGFLGESSLRDATEFTDSGTQKVFSTVVTETGEKPMRDLEKNDKSHLQDMKKVMQSHATNDMSNSMNKISTGMKPKVIRSVKEAREFLSRKHAQRKDNLDPQVRHLQEVEDNLVTASDQELKLKTGPLNYNNDSVFESTVVDDTSSHTSIQDACEPGDSTLDKTGLATDFSHSLPGKVHEPGDLQENIDMDDHMLGTLQDFRCSNGSTEAPAQIDKDSWIEKNFQEFEPIVSKIRVGFRENYMVAKEKDNDESLSIADLRQLVSGEDDSELEWMRDDGLREIVFKVRENELAGRDPFYLMDADDKHAFFKGLERKVEIENAKLSNLHEWIHSNVENIDYGADGISLYDRPEKIMPRWKGPPVDKDPEFLNNFSQNKSFVTRKMGGSHPMNKNAQEKLQNSENSLSSVDISTSSLVCDQRKTSQGGDSEKLKTVIESSDGSVRAGKKYGKEHWQHTKKWSQGFLEAYNAETDPEIKSIMKDMGKDLDRWITEDEIQEAADLMTRIPKRKRKYIEKKLNKLKREMEMFGQQAVVSKYREYAEVKEEDYLWWLDLPHVLCIELYTVQDGVQKVGFYSLEMAADLELEPKPLHVIAFEDTGDSKNLCYIIQAHMDMLGNGKAFVVARPPKDAFREAKANGFNVTVIRKGELQLNVDRTLEEVEEEISEIGSKMYHDTIMRERSVDVGSLMKGVFGSSKSTKRQRSKPKLRERTKH